MLKTLVFMCLVGSSACRALAGNAAEQDTAPTRVPAAIELTTDMALFLNPSTSFFLGWQRNVNALFQLGLDGVTGYFGLTEAGQWLERTGVLAAFSGASLLVNRPFSLTAHDASHLEAARAIGASSLGLVQENGVRPMGFGEFFLAAFNFTTEPGLYWYQKAGLTWDEEARVSGEGLDTNLVTAAAMGRKINDGRGHVADLAPYVLNKTWGIGYFLETGPTSDGQRYVDLLSGQGWQSVTSTNIILLEAASCLLSGGSLALARGAAGYLAHGDPAAGPLELDAGDVRVYWPEVTTWLNPDNVSVSVLGEASWTGAVFFGAGVDAPVLGRPGAPAEVTVAARARMRGVTAGLELTTRFSGVPLVLGGVGVALGDHLLVGLEGHYGQGNTMRELREYPLGPGASAFVKAAF